MHRRESIIIILLVLLSASYAYAAVKIGQQISNYDAAKSQILRNMAENSSYPILQNQHYQTILRLSSNFNRNRYYSPALGRFISKDPIGFNGGMNLYRYADNNPALFVDPFGLRWVSRWVKWAYTIVDYDRTVKSRIAIYGYLTSDFQVTRYDWWHYEKNWITDPCASETTPLVSYITGIDLRYIFIENNPPNITLTYPFKPRSSRSDDWSDSAEKSQTSSKTPFYSDNPVP